VAGVPRTGAGRPVLVALLVALLAACGGNDGGGEAARPAPAEGAADAGADPWPGGGAGEEVADDRAWPVPEWGEVDPAMAGLDGPALDALAEQAGQAGSDCLVVTRDGELVGEWYWGDFDATTARESFSVTKSITSALVGIAQDRGLLDVDQPASDFIEEWRGTPSEDVTIRNLVSNDSGRFQDFQTDFVDMAIHADDKTAFSIALDQQHEPGAEWVYNNAAIQTLDAVIEEAAGMPTLDFARQELFEPVGMEDTDITTDAAGNTLTFMGARTSCRDLARFGLLFLRGGEWGGEQVVSEGWVEESLRPSTPLNPAHGLLWWLNRPGTGGEGTGEEAREGERLAPAGPQDMVAALGLHGQLVAVLPSSGVVATRLGAPSGDDGATFGLNDLAGGLQEALGEPLAEPPGEG
jgi:CubicO group peptidase (beta-lactamase class C family)